MVWLALPTPGNEFVAKSISFPFVGSALYHIPRCRYRGPWEDDASELTLKQFIMGLILDNVFYVQYYASLFGVAVWASCYAAPAILEKIYSRKRAQVRI